MPTDTQELTVAVQEVQPWSRRLTITVPAERVKRTRDSVTSRFAQQMRMPGFRQGKTPTRLAAQRFGPAIDQETIDTTIQEAYRAALESEGLTPITQGKVEKVDYEPGADLTFEVEFEVQPKIEVARVSGFTVTRTPLEVGEAEVDAVLDQLREERAVLHPLEGDAPRPDYGDEVTVEITALEGADASDEPRNYRFVLGEGQAIPMVEESILTLSPGEEGEFTVRFPEDFPDEAQRGQEQRLHIRLLEAKRKELPALDDELAKAVGDFEDVAALRARILEDLRRDAELRAESEVRGQLLERILEANPLELPGSMVERYLDHITRLPERGDQQLAPEEQARYDQLRESLRPQAEWSLKRMLVVDHLAEREGLNATQDEIDARVEEIAQRNEMSASAAWLQLEKTGQLESLEREITEEKVFGHLKSLNTIA